MKPSLSVGAEPAENAGRWDGVVFGMYTAESGEFVYKRVEGDFTTAAEAEAAAWAWAESHGYAVDAYGCVTDGPG